MIKIAHRGYNAKDNTRQAFQNAVKYFDILEADIHKTADDKLVLIHDDFIVDRLIEDTYLHKLLHLDPDIMTLDEFFVYFPPRKFKIYLDLKGSTEIAPLLIKYLEENQVPLENIIIASFNRKHLDILLYSGLNIKLGFITYNTFNSAEYGSLLNSVDYLIVDTSNLNKELIEDVAPYQVKIMVCTCNSKDMYHYICNFPVYGVVSDIII